MVVVTADHGEAFNEHGFIGHGTTLYRETVQVPLLIIHPPGVPGLVRVHAPVSLRDIPSTIADLAGLRDLGTIPGRSLRRYWDDSAGAGQVPDTVASFLGRTADKKAWYPAASGDMVSVVYGDMRYIRNGDGTEELYDARADVGETSDLSPLPERAPDLDRFRRIVDHLEQDRRQLEDP